MLAQLGSEAPVPLAETEERIERHLASLLERMEGVPDAFAAFDSGAGVSRLQFFVLD